MSPAARHRAARRERIIADLRTHLAAHPPSGATRVILFGSLARGDFDAASDADILVIGSGSLDNGVHRAVGRDIDLIAWPDAGWREAIEAGHPFAREVERDGVELWREPD